MSDPEKIYLDDVIYGLELCSGEKAECEECRYYGTVDCTKRLKKDAARFLKEQEEDIHRLGWPKNSW